ncbi:MAG: hypothetical protein AB1586_26650 [Pseudomonadota bacterium]
MKLIRFDSGKTGLVIDRADGRYVIDVVGSLRALAPEDPITQGVLNGILKDRGSWAPVIEHWSYVRRGLMSLARQAMAREESRLVIHPFDAVRFGNSSIDPDSIASLDIAEQREVAHDPTGHDFIARQAAGRM